MTYTTVEFKGRQPKAIIEGWIGATQITVPVMLRAGQRQRTRNLKRVESGRDVGGLKFEPYSTNGPYYYYPGQDASSASGRKAATTRFARKLGLQARLKSGRFRTPKGALPRLASNQAASKEATAKAEGIKRTPLGVRFPSYAAFKRALRGTAIVDLRGPKAPHMLQALVVRAGGEEIRGGGAPGGYESDPGAGGSPGARSSRVVDGFTIGIYGPEAARAAGHMKGTRRLPQRRFFGASEGDRRLIVADILTGVMQSIRAEMRNGGTS